MSIIPEYTKALYLFKGMKEESKLTKDHLKKIRSFIALENLYLSAAREVETKFENLNSEFKYTQERNPIHSINTRIKSPGSIIRKLQNRGHELSVEAAQQFLTDIAGVRVICSYIDDIYLIRDLLLSQNDIKLIRESDYIKQPKSNGYRSLHLVISIPVFLSSKTELVQVEIQIRTIAMDFWASLEHELAYKLDKEKRVSVSSELEACANEIADIDKRMQSLFSNTIK